jgi:hypothetical protein
MLISVPNRIWFRRSPSVQLDDLLTAVPGVTDNAVVSHVDHPIHRLEGDLADQGGAILGEFGDIDRTMSP